MSDFQLQNPETVLLHGGQSPDPATGSRAVPIYQTTSYVFRDTEHAQNLFGLAETGNIYSRIMNPTIDAFEQRVAELEDGIGALATSSGMAAITLSILNIAGSGDEIIADSNLYGGTYNLFATTLPQYGIEVKFVDGTNLSEIEAAITDRTKAIFGEIITNPSLNVFDVEAVADIAHANGIPLIIDNTFATPYVSKPLTWGADIVVHSATKWIGGHGTTIGGIVVDGGRFNWDNERFPNFSKPDKSYNGLRYKDIGAAAFITKLRVHLLRDIGACLSPQNAFLFLQGLETLHLRIKRHTENAQQVATYLKGHPDVEWVNYPGLEEHPSHETAKKYLRDGFGSIITFGIKGGREAGRKLIDNVKLWSHVANVGDAKSLIIHPASTTHQQLTEEELVSSGVTEELVRLSVGLESAKDIIGDLNQAITAANGKSSAGTSADEAVKWLLSSPFDRSNGVRKKVIAVAGNSLDTSGITKLGFEVLTVGTEPGNDYQSLEAISSQLDAVWVQSGNEQTPDLVKQLDSANGKLLIFDTAAPSDVHELAREKGLVVAENQNVSKEAVNLRSHQTLSPASPVN